MTLILLAECVSADVSGVGGTNFSIGTYMVHVFNAVGSDFTWNATSSGNVEVLVIAGGGGGGRRIAGGGGAGGLILNTSYPVVAGAVYNISVGAGGSGKIGADGAGTNGSNSYISGLIAVGGGGGGGYTDASTKLGKAGGSGGGGGYDGGTGGAGVTGQGNYGGKEGGGGGTLAGGGGGGAGSPGGNTSGAATNGGVGGNGTTINFNGTSFCYAGGGGGGVYQSSTGNYGFGACGGGNGSKYDGGDKAQSGVNGTGGGGGGGGQADSSTGANGGTGGNGIVMLRYAITPETPFNKIDLLTRSPSDIIMETPFNYYNLTFVYDYFNITNLTPGNIYLNYSLLSTLSTCARITNGSCNLTNGSYRLESPISQFNYTNGSSNLTYSLNENQYVPTTQNIDIFNRTFTLANITLTAGGTDDYYVDYIRNFTNTTVNYTIMYETTLKTSANGLTAIYLLNQSYTEGTNLATANNVVEVCNFFNITSYNHTHNNGAIGHNLCRIDVVNGKVGNLTVTPSLGFAHRPIIGTATITTIDYSARVGSARYTANNGATWSEANTQPGHAHFFRNTDALVFKAMFIFSNGTVLNSSLITDNYDVSYPPRIPTITNPTNNEEVNVTPLRITWDDAGIASYNVSLLNSDLSFNRSIIFTTGLNYSWNVFKENLTLGVYFIRIVANNSYGTRLDIEGFNLTRNAELNISARYWLTNDAVTGFNVTVTDTDTSEVYINVTASSLAIIPVVRGHNYTVLFASTNYSSNSTSITMPNLDAYNYTFIIYRYNSLNIQFYDEQSGLKINETQVFLDLVSDIFSGNYSTNNGTLVVDLLFPTTYQARFYASGYVERFYSFTVEDDTFQVLTLYLSNASESVLVRVRDSAINPVEGAVVKVQKVDPVTNSYLTVEIGTTNSDGEVTMSLSLNDEWYRALVYVDGALVLTTEPAYIIASPWILTIAATTNLDDLINYYTITGDVYYEASTATFYFDFDDPNNVHNSYCLKIENSSDPVNTTCVTADSGQISYTITIRNGTTFTATGFVLLQTYVPLDQEQVTFASSESEAGSLGLLGLFVIGLVLVLIGLSWPETIPLLVGLSFILTKWVGLIDLEWYVCNTILLLGAIISIWVGRNKSN